MIEPTSPTLACHVKNAEVEFNWQPPADLPATYVTGYVLYYRSEDDAIEQTVRVNSTTTKLLLEDFQTGINYVATLTYLTKLGTGATSEKKKIIMKG